MEHILATTNESRLGGKVSTFSQHFQDLKEYFVSNNDAIFVCFCCIKFFVCFCCIEFNTTETNKNCIVV